MPKRSDESVPIMDGEALLTKRRKSPFWQLKFRVGKNFIRTSTKCSDLDDATKFSRSYYLKALAKDEANIPLVTRKFKSVAEAVRDRFKRDFENNIGPVINRDYYQAIDNWLIPFFGNYNIATIEHKHIKAFYEYRQDKMGKAPAQNTINTHALTLSYVFAEAVTQEYMTEHHIPVVKLKGYAAKNNNEMPRASFTMAEYTKLHRFMRYWVERGKKGKFTDMRNLLREAALFLANSGIRCGTELESIRWKNVQITISEKTGYECLHVFVNGKTGPRWTNVRYGGRVFLERIWGRSETLKDLTWDELLTRDEPVFALPDGTVTKALDKVFRRMLNEAGMQLDSNGEPRTLYSLRHFYITQELYRNNVSPAVVAKQCGTSLKMLEQHYFNYDYREHADALSGRSN